MQGIAAFVLSVLLHMLIMQDTKKEVPSGTSFLSAMISVMELDLDPEF